MRIPKGKGFDLAGGLVITVVLEDILLVGTFLGAFGDQRSHHQECEPIHVDLKCDNDPEFFLLQLKCSAFVESVEFPRGTIIAINVNEVQFIAIGGECDCDSEYDDHRVPDDSNLSK
jgi:hypothetical protein